MLQPGDRAACDKDEALGRYGSSEGWISKQGEALGRCGPSEGWGSKPNASPLHMGCPIVYWVSPHPCGRKHMMIIRRSACRVEAFDMSIGIRVTIGPSNASTGR